jgi:hypothetical protein
LVSFPLNGDLNCRDGEKKRDSTLKENITLSLSVCAAVGPKGRKAFVAPLFSSLLCFLSTAGKKKGKKDKKNVPNRIKNVCIHSIYSSFPLSSTVL